VRNPVRVFLLVLVLSLCLAPLVAYSITIEEFIEKYPDAVVALSANYYPNGGDKPATWSSGFTDRDSYALKMGNVIAFRELYDSKIVRNGKLLDLIKRADGSIDLASSTILLGKSDVNGKMYSEKYGWQEQIHIPDETGCLIIEKLLGGVYDGNNISYINGQRPDFTLQLAAYPVTRGDSVYDGASRVDGSDPTPPIYGDVE
jgi:hypothetical protein